MPHIQVQVSGSADAELARSIAAEVTDITASVLRKDPSLVAITVEFIATDRWFIGKEPLSESGLRSFFLAISVTDETNLKAEKAQYIAAIHAFFERRLGGVSEKSYIHVVDARATAYGYGGLTQETRYQRARS